VRQSLKKDHKSLLEARKVLAVSPEKSKPSKYHEKLINTAPSKLRKASQDTGPSNVEMEEYEIPQQYDKHLDVLDLRIKNIERTLHQVVEFNFMTPTKEHRRSSGYSPPSTKDTASEYLEEMRKMKQKITNLERKFDGKSELNASWKTPERDRNREKDAEQEIGNSNSLKQQNQLLLKELEKKNSQLQSLVELNLNLENQLSNIREQNEKEFSMVEKVSYYLKDNLSKIIGGEDLSSIEAFNPSSSVGTRKFHS
jgi:hypothetical protein